MNCNCGLMCTVGPQHMWAMWGPLYIWCHYTCGHTMRVCLHCVWAYYACEHTIHMDLLYMWAKSRCGPLRVHNKFWSTKHVGLLHVWTHNTCGPSIYKWAHSTYIVGVTGPHVLPQYILATIHVEYIMA